VAQYGRVHLQRELSQGVELLEELLGKGAQ
jgi:hypothetical protein